jgi:hypothetical protein
VPHDVQDESSLGAMKKTLTNKGAIVAVVAPHGGFIKGSNGGAIPVEHAPMDVIGAVFARKLRIVIFEVEGNLAGYREQFGFDAAGQRESRAKSGKRNAMMKGIATDARATYLSTRPLTADLA